MNAAATTTAVLSGLDRARSSMEDFYRHLHQHPELSHQETTTAAEVVDRLKGDGYDVTSGVGGTGVIGVLRNGDGPTVLLRADMDALPVQEETGLPYASTITATDSQGATVPVMHACGHDVHVSTLLTAAALLAAGQDRWQGGLVVLFQPAEEVGDGAQGMVQDGLATIVGKVDVALAQHVLPLPAGVVGTRNGAVLSAADSMRITLHGRGAHGSMPQAAVDPVVLASMIVVRLQTVISREVAPTEPAVLTVGSIHSGSKSNVIGDQAVLELNIRTYDEQTRAGILAAIRRVVVAECEASAAPAPPEFEMFDRFPTTTNDSDTTGKVAAAFSDHFGDRAIELPLQSASEDFSDIPTALGVPYTYWGIGGIDPTSYRTAAAAGRVAQDIPVNHSPHFAPVLQPTLDTGTQALVVAALAFLSAN
ncbi:amidohydrolase [Amnibacterium sp.]|uniref:amidohydrolase n=1 Tax=Amnibacterium sp. TaxID=1872496 RepID=UPI00260F79FC|nr:amidohydrolase [Amnibacterium sp.]MCU1472904.1 amidohydrolase [Amnibacterium sp.]